MNKKILFVLLAILLVITLVSCKKQSDTGATVAQEKGGTALAASLDGKASKEVAWPTKPVTIVVPFGSGGDSDFNARVLAKYLTEELKQTFVVDNIAGSGGSVGTEDVADSKPDGYKILQNHNALQISYASGISDVSLDDMAFVGVTGKNPGDVIAVSSKVGITNMKELVEASKKKKMTVATNIGATTQVESFMLGEYANVTQVDVGPIADKVTALLGGQVDIIIGPYGNIQPYVESGDFAIVGVCTPERAEGFPEVPTCVEQGYDGINWETSFFYAFPKGTDQAIIDKFASALEKIITTNSSYATEIMKAYYQSPIWLPGEEGKALMREAGDTISKYTLTYLK